MSLEDKLSTIINKYEQLETKMLNPEAVPSSEFAKTAKERADLEPIFILAKEYNAVNEETQDISNMITDPEMDEDMKDLAIAEKAVLEKKLAQLLHDLKILLLPKDIADEKGAILELRAGTGGEEAALFCAVLFRMYKKYSERYRWKFEVLSFSDTGLDGLKEAVVSISGKGVFARLKYESGVHRVQRIPETESSGRIHTSAATVAVLPEAEEVDIEIDEKDLKIDVYRASGAGGQHVNTTDSAVRITHIPTGIVVCQQDEKSQHKNKARAMKILRSRLYDAQRNKINAERSALRKVQVGSGDRSERIRTYNYPQGRITDHRIHITSYALEEVLNEGKLDQFIDALINHDQVNRLSENDY